MCLSILMCRKPLFTEFKIQWILSCIEEQFSNNLYVEETCLNLTMIIWEYSNSKTGQKRWINMGISINYK